MSCRAFGLSKPSDRLADEKWPPWDLTGPVKCPTLTLYKHLTLIEKYPTISTELSKSEVCDKTEMATEPVSGY